MHINAIINIYTYITKSWRDWLKKLKYGNFTQKPTKLESV